MSDVVAGDPRDAGLLLDRARASRGASCADQHVQIAQTLERREHAIRFGAAGADERAVVARPPSAVAVHGSPSAVHGPEHGLDVAEDRIGWRFEDGRAGETLGARDRRRQFGGANAIDPAVAQHREADDHHRDGHRASRSPAQELGDDESGEDRQTDRRHQPEARRHAQRVHAGQRHEAGDTVLESPDPP